MSTPWRVTRALQLYDQSQRGRTVVSRRARVHELLALLDAMTPLQQSLYYAALVKMRKDNKTTALPQRNRKMR